MLPQLCNCTLALIWVYFGEHTEPKVAERYLRAQLAAAGVRLFLQEHVVSVELRRRAPNVIGTLVTNTSRRFFGDVFIDATYEADLLPLAGVSHRVGREAASEYVQREPGWCVYQIRATRR